MKDLRSEISKEISNLGVDAERFKPVNIVKWKGIEKRIASSFLLKGEADLNRRWWWEHLKERSFACMPFYAPDVIAEIVPPEEQVYFIVEDDARNDDKLWIYEGYIVEFVKLLESLHSFEYYVVSKKMKWLLCENHHSYLISSGREMCEKLKEAKVDNA